MSLTNRRPRLARRMGLAILLMVACALAAPVQSFAADAVSVTAKIIGPSVLGTDSYWAQAETVEMEPGSTAADLTERVLEDANLSADYDPDGQYGFYLDTITAPDGSATLGWDEATGRYWQLFVDGAASASSASSIQLADGMSVTWYYSAYGATLPTAALPCFSDVVATTATVSVIGPDGSGADSYWAEPATIRLAQGSTAADLTERMLEQTELQADYQPSGSGGFYLDTITAPDGSATLGWDEATGRYWQLFVNGRAASVGASDVKLADGMSVTWYYSAYGEELPSLDALPGFTPKPAEPAPDPDPDTSKPGEGDSTTDEGDALAPTYPSKPNTAPLPSYTVAWGGASAQASGSVVHAVSTPTGSAGLGWKVSYTSGSQWGTTPGLIIADGALYVASNQRVLKIDAASGAVLATGAVEGMNGYFCRPVYADGLIIVPCDGGVLTALRADTLEMVWRTAPLTESNASDYQSLSSLTVSNGRVVAGFTVPGTPASVAGVLRCVNISDGTIAWEYRESNGYYWAGALAVGGDFLIGDDSGFVTLFDGATGEVRSRLSVGAPVRAGIVTDGAGRYIAVTSDGVLHVLTYGNGGLHEVRRISFAASSTSTPAIVDGKAYVCGANDEGYGILAVISLESGRVERTVAADRGTSQSSPLVVVQSSGTYAYFTCNEASGSVWVYRVGDDAARKLFVPDEGDQNWCTASVVTDGTGALYYTNDSGQLFKLVADEGQNNHGSSNVQSNGGAGDATGSGSANGNSNMGGNTAAGNNGGGNGDNAAGGNGAAASDNGGTGGEPAARTEQGSGDDAAQTGDRSQDGEEASDEDAVTSATRSASSQAKAAVHVRGSEVSGPNVLAIAGVVVGVIGLLAICGYLMWRR